MQFKWPLYCGGCIFVIYNARLTCLYVVDGVILYIYRIYTLIIFFIYIFIVRIQCSKISTNYLLLYIYHIFSQYLSFYMKNVLPSLSFLKGDLFWLAPAGLTGLPGMLLLLCEALTTGSPVFVLPSPRLVVGIVKDCTVDCFCRMENVGQHKLGHKQITREEYKYHKNNKMHIQKTNLHYT